jgi:hypothetical protein
MDQPCIGGNEPSGYPGTFPIIFGSGIWYSIHTVAKHLPREAAILAVKTLLENFKCSICREHINSYIKANPIEHTDVFLWTIGFHNAVNDRLGKKQLSLEIALKLY